MKIVKIFFFGFEFSEKKMADEFEDSVKEDLNQYKILQQGNVHPIIFI